MAEQTLDVNMFTSPFQLTKSMHRDLYPAIEPTNPALSATGKVIMITGAGGGLGAVSREFKKRSNRIKLTLLCQAIARAWAQAGAAGIILVGRKADTLNLTAENIAKISSSVPVISVPTDVTIESCVQQLFQKAKGKFDKVQVLVNAAGTMGGDMIGDAPLASWWADFVSALL